jgi:predicted nucleotidyltransferase
MGNGALDAALRTTVTKLLLAFPARIRSIYLLGSYAFGHALPSSDVDLVVVFGGQVGAQEERDAHALVAELAAQTTFDLGALVTDEDQLRVNERGRGAPYFPVPMIVLASIWLYGEDQRTSYRLWPASTWGRHCLRLRYLHTGVDRRLTSVCLPLPLPNSADTFGGYLSPPRNKGSHAPPSSTRDLVTRAGWLATARVALDANHYIVRKVDVVSSYARLIADQWTPFLVELFAACRDRWQYGIPAAATAQAHLRGLCTQYGEFENACLRRCQAKFCADLQQGTWPEVHWTLETLERLPFAAPEIIAALEQLAVTHADLAPRVATVLQQVT